MDVTPDFKTIEVALDDLLFDPNNFRFQDEPGYIAADPTRFAERKVQDRAAQRLRSEGIVELKNSILANGFLTVERIVVRAYGEDASKFLVVEGNRRLAALKWIRDDYDAGVPVSTELVELFGAVPVLEITSQDTESAYLAIMGVRHVGGIKEWGGYQRAKLVTELRDSHEFDTQEVASRLGMSAHEVNRRYRAFKALQQMQNDEEYGELASSSMYPIFHEALAIPAVREWLEWNESKSQFASDEQLHLFYDLITPTPVEDDEDAGDPQPAKMPTYLQVRELKSILHNGEAKRVLFDRDRSFNDALGIAKAEEISQSWRTQLAEAISVMNTIGALELAAMTDTDVESLKKVKSLSESLIGLHKKLTSK
ncbi:ParB N-terminal domain-containing protein [Agromyces sp. CCNWLW203]|uniref:ParB N-terminal domain-containing protein n=1 Tax=Agromyces sp. CCNWLW203 TaxID=3112842 RepID=UPI002F96C26B